MTVQTTYSINHAALFAGMINSLNPSTLISKLNKTASVIPYGKGVVSDGEDGADLPVPASTAAEFNGVVMYEINRAQADGDVAGGVPGNDMTVISHGRVAVVAHATVAKDDPVFLVVGANGPGDFSNVAASGGDLGVAISGAKFLTGGDAGDIVEISLGAGS